MDEIEKLARDLVSHLGQTLNISTLELDPEGFCSVNFDQKLTITLFADPHAEQLVLSAELGTVDEDSILEIYEAMLQANYAWGETGGLGTLSVAPRQSETDSRRACMMHQAGVRFLNDGSFQNLFEAFLNTAEAWVDYLAQFKNTQEETPDADKSWDEDPSVMRV